MEILFSYPSSAPLPVPPHPAKARGAAAAACPSLIFLRAPLCSARNPNPNRAHSSPGPPLVLRFRPSPRQIAQQLKTLGIRASPESLDWILSAVSFLRSKGFSNHHLSRLLNQLHTSAASPERTLDPVFAFLAGELFASPDHSRDFILRRPELLSCSVEHRLRPTLAFLRDLGIKNLHLPSALNASLLITPADKLASKIGFLQSLGLSHEESAGICRRFPAIFGYSEENNLRPKFEYLVFEMGGSVEEVKRFPQYFGFCLKKRIAPRHLHLKRKNIRPSLKWMLMPGDDKFYAKWK